MRTGWSSDDLRRLQAYCAERWSYARMAVMLGRSPAAVQCKADDLGYSNGLKRGPARGGTRKAPPSPLSARALDRGNAAELLVCADLILSGHRAFQASQGLPYDVVADINGRLVRIGVKSAHAPAKRPGREGSRVCYQFGIARSSKNKTQRGERYTTKDFDLCALVALDIRQVIYIEPTFGTYPTSFHVDPPSTPPAPPGRNGIARKHWSHFPIGATL